MNEWFECSVRYEKTLENGMQKYVSEPYLVEAISFTEAEQRFIEEIQPFMSGEYEVKAVSKRKISELLKTTKSLPTNGLNVRSHSSRWMKGVVLKSVKCKPLWYKPPACGMP